MTDLNDFPYSSQNPFTVTSPIDNGYNCIAHAAGVQNKWYEPDPFRQFYWPPNIPREYTVEAYIQVYEQIGYERCANGDLEDGYEKVAVFEKNKMPTHAARQLPDGQWTSKLGRYVDVTHNIQGISYGSYGTVSQYLRRPI